MLEMSEPVRISKAGKNLLLRLCGASSKDRIVLTGVRPGEKLHGGLVDPDEETIETEIPKVRLIRAPRRSDMSSGR